MSHPPDGTVDEGVGLKALPCPWGHPAEVYTLGEPALDPEAWGVSCSLAACPVYTASVCETRAEAIADWNRLMEAVVSRRPSPSEGTRGEGLLTDDAIKAYLAPLKEQPASTLTFIAEQMGEFLSSLLFDGSAVVREGAIIGIEKGLPYLRHLAANDPSEGVRTVARDALSEAAATPPAAQSPAQTTATATSEKPADPPKGQQGLSAVAAASRAGRQRQMTVQVEQPDGTTTTVTPPAEREPGGDDDK